MRQARLADVGEAGQARLEAASLALTTRGEAARVERRYLEAAGATLGGGPDDAAPTPALPFEIHDPAAREVAAGAHAALVTLRRVWLGGGPKAGTR